MLMAVLLNKKVSLIACITYSIAYLKIKGSGIKKTLSSKIYFMESIVSRAEYKDQVMMRV